VAKCVLLCKNCHAKVHARKLILDVPPIKIGKVRRLVQIYLREEEIQLLPLREAKKAAAVAAAKLRRKISRRIYRQTHKKKLKAYRTSPEVRERVRQAVHRWRIRHGKLKRPGLHNRPKEMAACDYLPSITKEE
jgi:hypothetical protein